MGKTEQVARKSSREESIAQVKELVGHAAVLLKSLSPEHSRLAWMLEDTLMYLDEIDESSAAAGLDLPTDCSGPENLCKTANVTSS
jgi:hypothetical protein